MRLPYISLLLFIALINGLIPAGASSSKHRRHADPHAADLVFIKQAYAYQDYGCYKQDVNEALSYTTDDFEATDEHGIRRDKPAMTQQLYAMFVAANRSGASMSVHTRVVKAKFVGDTATIITECSAQASNPASGRSASATGYYDEDTWVRAGKGWALKSSITYTQGQVVRSSP